MKKCSKCNNIMKPVIKNIIRRRYKSYSRRVGYKCYNSRCENFDKLITSMTGRNHEKTGLAYRLWIANNSDKE